MLVGLPLLALIGLVTYARGRWVGTIMAATAACASMAVELGTSVTFLGTGDDLLEPLGAARPLLASAGKRDYEVLASRDVHVLMLV